MSMRFAVLVFFVFLTVQFYSCADESSQVEDTELSAESQARYGDVNFDFPRVSPAADQKLSQWPFFDDFNTEIRSLNGVSIERLRLKTERLTSITDSLQVKIPDSLNTRPISSRLMIVNTRIKMLDQMAQRRNWDSIVLQNYFDETNKSVAHFFKQINEKFLKDGIDEQRREDEEKELEKQKRFRDSIFELEIQDKNRKAL